MAAFRGISLLILNIVWMVLFFYFIRVAYDMYEKQENLENEVVLFEFACKYSMLFLSSKN